MATPLRWTRVALLPAIGLIAGSAWAAPPFDGTWKIDVSSIDHPAKPSVYAFKDGMYECKTCAVPFKVKVDGKDQKIEGNPYADTLAVKVIDKHNLELIAKKGGKPVAKRKVAVSKDGNSMMVEYADNAPGGKEVMKGATSYARTAYDRAGDHQMSGSWKAIKEEKRSDNGLLLTYRSEGAALGMSNPMGRAYVATPGGPEAPVTGDPGFTHVAVQVKKNTLEETWKRDGKTVFTTRMEVLADGKTAKIDWIDPITRTNGNYSLKRQ